MVEEPATESCPRTHTSEPQCTQHTRIYKINNKSPLFGLELNWQGIYLTCTKLRIQSPGLSNLVTHISYLITPVEGPEVQGHL